MEVIMEIKDRIKSYEPLFDQWLFDEIIDVYNHECLIKLKHQSYGNEKRTAYLNVITVYDQHDSIEELEKRVEDIKNNFKDNQKSLQNDLFEYEQYLIENDQGNIIGIDLCILMEEDYYIRSD